MKMQQENNPTLCKLLEIGHKKSLHMEQLGCLQMEFECPHKIIQFNPEFSHAFLHNPSCDTCQGPQINHIDLLNLIIVWGSHTSEFMVSQLQTWEQTSNGAIYNALILID